jgi:hypothetical protein
MGAKNVRLILFIKEKLCIHSTQVYEYMFNVFVCIHMYIDMYSSVNVITRMIAMPSKIVIH